MKIDSKTIGMLRALPDDAFWKIITSIGAQSGLDLSGMKPSHSDLERLRETLSKLTDSDIDRAMEILKNQKKRS